MAGLGLRQHEFGNSIGHVAVQTPRCCILHSFPGRAIARAQPAQLEPGMVLQEPDEMLANHASSAKNADVDRFHMPYESRSTSCRYKPTASINSDLGIR